MEINLISEYANHNRMDSHSFIPRAKTTLTADLFFDDDDSLNDERIDTILAFHDTKHVHKHNNNNENDNDGNGNSQNVDGQKQENENNNNNSWILYNNAKSPRLPVSVQTFNPETPRRSLSNLASKQSKRSSDKNLNTSSNGEKYYFQSDDNDSIDNIRNSGKHDEDNEEEETCMNAKNSSVHYDLFRSSPSLTRASQSKYDSNSNGNGKAETNEDDLITHNNGMESSNTKQSAHFEAQLFISKSYHRDLKSNKNRQTWPQSDDDCVLITSPTQKNLFDDYVHIASSNKK
mmetsp:Transcript_70088/g.111483  ORF Transcript_70088/g.111483 Transcript_70088/m.111483 type:complete len:290 (+) Transcript_70088:1-870(+)